MFGHLTRAPLPAGPAHRQDQSAYPAFCELAVRLYTPNLHNLGAKSLIVSGLHLKYSRFLETRARDRARSALRGVGGSTADHGHHIHPILDERSRSLARIRPVGAPLPAASAYSSLIWLGALPVQRWNARLKFAASLNPSARAISSFARFVLRRHFSAS